MDENEQLKRLLALIALNSDESAYKELFMLMYHRLKQFAFSILRSQEEDEELVSDVFIKIWEKRTRLTLIESPRLYFYISTKNLAITRLNRKKRGVLIEPNEWLAQLDSIYFDPEKLMITEDVFRQIQKAVSDLPPRCRMIFKLIKEDGLRYKEVAELLHLSIKTVENQMSIALKRISRCMRLDILHFPSSN